MWQAPGHSIAVPAAALARLALPQLEARRLFTPSRMPIPVVRAAVREQPLLVAVVAVVVLLALRQRAAMVLQQTQPAAAVAVALTMVLQATPPAPLVAPGVAARAGLPETRQPPVQEIPVAAAALLLPPLYRRPVALEEAGRTSRRLRFVGSAVVVVAPETTAVTLSLQIEEEMEVHSAVAVVVPDQSVAA